MAEKFLDTKHFFLLKVHFKLKLNIIGEFWWTLGIC